MKVVGLGDQVVDNYEHIKTMFPGGNALNFAVFSKQLGHESAFLGVFGDDIAGTHVYNTVKNQGVDLSHSKCFHGENGCARVTIINGDRVFLGSNKGGVVQNTGLSLNKADYSYLMEFDLIHSSVYSYSEKEVRRLKEMGAEISFDFSDDCNEEKLMKILPCVTYAFFSTSHLSESERETQANKALNNGCELCLCTCGSKGAVLFHKSGVYHSPVYYVEAIDTMAAGDAFITCFITEYISTGRSESSIADSLDKAAKFSASQCLIKGSFGHGLKYGND